MRIGIIGAGNIGGALTRRLTALGHEVAVANSRGPESLADLAAETAPRPSRCEAARAGEVVIVTIPMKNIPDLPKDLFAGVPGSVVVSTPATTTRSSATAASPGSRRADRERLGRAAARPAGDQGVQQHLRQAPAGAGQARRHPRPHRPARGGRRPAAKAVVHAARRRAGLRSASTPAASPSPGVSSPARPVYAKDFDADGVRRALAAASPERTAAWRATPTARGTSPGPPELIQTVRWQWQP